MVTNHIFGLICRFIPECYVYAIQEDITVISRDFSMKHALRKF